MHARYDEGHFNTKATKLGLLRIILAPVVIVGLFSINVALQVTSQEIDQAYYSGFNWTNSVTGRTVAIPAGWIHESKDNVNNQPIDVFSSPTAGTFVLFAKEDIESTLSIGEYAKLWAVATGRDNVFDHPWSSNHSTWTVRLASHWIDVR